MELSQFIRSQEADEGGFREIRVSKRAGTNPTAAAIGVLRILDAVSEEIREGTIDFSLRNAERRGRAAGKTRESPSLTCSAPSQAC